MLVQGGPLPSDASGKRQANIQIPTRPVNSDPYVRVASFDDDIQYGKATFPVCDANTATHTVTMQVMADQGTPVTGWITANGDVIADPQTLTAHAASGRDGLSSADAATAAKGTGATFEFEGTYLHDLPVGAALKGHFSVDGTTRGLSFTVSFGEPAGGLPTFLMASGQETRVFASTSESSEGKTPAALDSDWSLNLISGTLTLPSSWPVVGGAKLSLDLPLFPLDIVLDPRGGFGIALGTDTIFLRCRHKNFDPNDWCFMSRETIKEHRERTTGMFMDAFKRYDRALDAWKDKTGKTHSPTFGGVDSRVDFGVQITGNYDFEKELYLGDAVVAAELLFKFVKGKQFAFVLFGFLTWRTLKTPLVVLLCVLLVADAVSSWSLAYGNQDGSSPQERLQADEQRMLVDEAKQLATQRLALVDESRFDSESAYVATGLGDLVAISEGAAWQSSVTASNFMQLDRALEQGEFDYLFDRSLEMGDDSVIVCTSLVKERDDSTEGDLDAAAERSGYALVDENGEYRLHHRDTPTSFGVKSDYRAIAIGSSAPMVALQFPAFREGDSEVLDEYSFDDLKGYDVVFLGGFTYRDRNAAEDLVYRLADAGVRIVVAADGIPADEHTGSKVFLGLDCESIAFRNGFPELQTASGPLVTTLFPDGYQNWDTVYVNGIENPRAVIEEGSYTLPVYGTLDDRNIVVIGLNLTYYESLTHDAEVAELLSDALGVSSDELPVREVVGLSVDYAQDGRSIAISSPEDNVNTTIAYQDIFESESALKRQNNLLVVGKGDTTIEMRYPYLWQGLVVSAAGLAASVAFFAVMRARERRRNG